MKKKIIYSDWIVVFFFACFTLMMFYPIARYRQIRIIGADWLFHASRAEQIYQNLKAGHLFTYIATTTFGNTGVASFLFYPTVFLYPWACLRFLFKPIEAYYIYLSIIMFFTFLSSYFSMKSFSRSKVQSFIFAILYGIAPYHIYLAPGTYVLGEYIAYAFVPIAFLGFYNVFWGNGKWWQLALGMSLLIETHVLSVFLCCELFIFILLIKFILTKKVINLQQCKALLKALSVTLLLTLNITIPFITDYVGKKVSSTYSTINGLVGLDGYFSTSLTNASSPVSYGIVFLVTLILGWSWIKGNKRYISIYVLGIFTALISTNIVPWWLTLKTVLCVVQLPWRYITYTNLFLGCVASYGLSKLVYYLSNKEKISLLRSIGIFVFFTTILYLGSVTQIVNQNKNTQNVAQYIQKNHGTIKNAKDPYMIDNKNYDNQFNYIANYGETDYYPEAALKYSNSILEHQAYINGIKKHVVPKATPSEIEYKLYLKTNSVVDLPCCRYNHTFVKVNHKIVKSILSKRGTVQIKLKKGKNLVEIGYMPPMVFYIGIVISLTSWIIFIKNYGFTKLRN